NGFELITYHRSARMSRRDGPREGEGPRRLTLRTPRRTRGLKRRCAMNILVTGGAGYIGSHACKALAAKGHVPITYDDLSRGNRWAVKWGPLLEGDIADAVCLRAALEQYRPAAL